MQSRLFSGDILPFLFHDSANTAFYMAVDALKAMQDSPAIGPTQYGIPAVNMWFLTVESVISTLYKIVLDDSKSSGAVKQTQKLLDKVEQIDAYISGGKSHVVTNAPQASRVCDIQKYSFSRSHRCKEADLFSYCICCESREDESS